MARLIICNEDQLNAALDRPIYLAGSAKGVEEERELGEINAAVESYEQSLAVETAASRSTRRTRDDVPSGTGAE